MDGVQKNFQNQRKKFFKNKNNDFVYLRDYLIDTNDLLSFTVFLKTMVTFTVFDITLYVY